MYDLKNISYKHGTLDYLAYVYFSSNQKHKEHMHTSSSIEHNIFPKLTTSMFASQ